MRARLPDESGYVVNSGVRIHYEVHGTGQTTILLLPTWAIVDSRHWKMQVPFLGELALDPQVRIGGDSGAPVSTKDSQPFTTLANVFEERCDQSRAAAPRITIED